MKKSRFSIFLLALVLCISLGTGGTAFAADTIKIGILGPFTGSLAFNAGEMKKGMMLALDEVNAKGGLFGKKVEIAFADTECKPDKGLAAVKKLVTRDNVLVVGGGYCSSVNIATSEFCQFEECPVVVAIAISPTITNRGYDFVFRTSPNSPMFLNGINLWLAQVKKPKTVAFFMENSDYGRDGQKIWEEQCKKIGAKVLANLYFEIGGTDFTSAISKLKDLNPDVVFNIASTTEAALIQKQAKELNYATQWIGVGGQFTQAYFKMTGPISEYAMGSSLEPTKAMKDPVTAAFVNAFLKKYPGSRPGIFSSQGYDNLQVILAAVKKAGKPTDDLAKDRLKIRDQLAKTDMKLSQGLIKFGKDGQVYTVIPSVVQVQLDKDCKPDTQIIFPTQRAAAKYEAPKPWSERKCK
ncbi:MAG: ABC transporter substrate-binding protein [Deltaproteobacteria bacterium]|jgi:branched-chain amino acid transport system substrate-binding protein|nr:ABC transporter substrate-binding protein [Deltaproteobacteria bacterium]